MTLRLAPCTVKRAIRFVAETHRRLPRIQGGMWAVAVARDGEIVGVAIVGHAAQEWTTEIPEVLSVLRVAVREGNPNACSMLYGACSRAARAMGAGDLVTYTHLDEPGTSLRAAGWIDAGETGGGIGAEKDDLDSSPYSQNQNAAGSPHGGAWRASVRL